VCVFVCVSCSIMMAICSIKQMKQFVRVHTHTFYYCNTHTLGWLASFPTTTTTTTIQVTRRKSFHLRQANKLIAHTQLFISIISPVFNSSQSHSPGEKGRKKKRRCKFYKSDAVKPTIVQTLFLSRLFQGLPLYFESKMCESISTKWTLTRSPFGRKQFASGQRLLFFLFFPWQVEANWEKNRKGYLYSIISFSLCPPTNSERERERERLCVPWKIDRQWQGKRENILSTTNYELLSVVPHTHSVRVWLYFSLSLSLPLTDYAIIN